MLTVQVEKDPKTGATTVRSVTPMSTPVGDSMAPTVFDDGRKSIHAVGGSAGHPSNQEIGQILSVIDGVGMKVLLEEVAVTPDKTETKMEHVEAGDALEEKVPSISNHAVVFNENENDVDAPMGDAEDEDTTAVGDVAGKVENIDDRMLDEGPVTLVFLGYADAASGDGTDAFEGREDHEGMLTAERVIITDEGEEIALGGETSSSSPRPTLDEAEAERQEEEAETDKAFQDVPLDGNGAQLKSPGVEGEAKLSSAKRAEEEVPSKHKTCQCCSVM